MPILLIGVSITFAALALLAVATTGASAPWIGPTALFGVAIILIAIARLFAEVSALREQLVRNDEADDTFSGDDDYFSNEKLHDDFPSPVVADRPASSRLH